MTKKFTLLQLFSIVDGRLATTMDDVYITLNHIMDDNLFTHHLPVAMDYLKQENPKWFRELKKKIKNIVKQCTIKERNQKQFEWIIEEVKKDTTEYEIPQLVSTSEEKAKFGKYMCDNSLLIKFAEKGKPVIVVKAE